MSLSDSKKINNEILENSLMDSQNSNADAVEILFASTNPGKIKRFKRIMADKKVKIWTLSDLKSDPNSDLSSIPEPEETGNNVVENAEVKARYYWDKLNQKMPVISEDHGTYFRNTEPEDNPHKDIKKPVVDKYGNYSQENMIKYYSELAKKYGGVLDQVWEYGFSIYDGTNCYTAKALADNVRLVETPKYQSYDGFPLSCLCQHLIDGQWKYVSEITQLQLEQHFEPPVKATILELMAKIGVD